jgi:hypothetical protein
MKLKDLLLERKSSILTKWFDKIIEGYPSDTSSFLKKQKNQFSNPVGNTISQGINGLFDVLVQGSDPDKVYPFLDDIIRIKAVQDFSPSQAVSFIFLLKQVLRDTMKKEIRENSIAEELALLESRIDEMILLSFDIYMKCRERIYEIKADEVKRMTFRLLQRANLICEVQEPDVGSNTVLTKNIKG